jgi:dolichyl-diphosphooligosaccharide---protein glycosyltransferase subunit DDOST/WBP1
MQVEGVNGNKMLADDLTKWTFHERLVIKSNGLHHHAPNSSELDPEVYRVADPVSVSFSLSQYNPSTDTYESFSTPSAYPVQLDVTMLDPYIRTLLPPTSVLPTETIYSKTFLLPDHYGVFHFKIQHRVPGYTYVTARKQFTIRHRQHNEYDRFISSAWSYYSGWMVVSAGFLVFCAVWMWHTPKPALGNKTKKSQ